MVNPVFRAPVAPLFVPGDRPERFARAADSGADAVILDLEDAVGAGQRERAREAVARHGITRVPVIVRVNAAASGELERDIKALQNATFSALMLAKAEYAADVRRIHALLGRQMPVIVLVETVAAFADLGTLLQAPGVVQAAFGSLDLALDLGCQPDWQALSHCRGALVQQSRLANIAAPLDGVTLDLDDPQQVREDAQRASRLGFGGKLLIHPRQVSPTLESFLPDATTLEWARRVLAATTSDAAVRIDGAMVDRPLIERARRIIARANMTGEC
ncbi:TPA: CoA ester lyase [Citrobacter freundii]